MIKLSDKSTGKPALAKAFAFLCIVISLLFLNSTAKGQGTATLTWNPPADPAVVGFYIYCGTTSGDYTTKIDVGLNSTFTVTNLSYTSNYFFAVSSYASDGQESDLSTEVAFTAPPTVFFDGNVSLGSGVDWLQFPDGNVFGYFNPTGFPWIYHYDLGFEYVFDAKDSQNGIYFYDASSGTFWYTTPTVWPYLYDFTLNSWIYYYPDATHPDRYTSNPRWFYNFATAQIISK